MAYVADLLDALNVITGDAWCPVWMRSSAAIILS